MKKQIKEFLEGIGGLLVLLCIIFFILMMLYIGGTAFSLIMMAFSDDNVWRVLGGIIYTPDGWYNPYIAEYGLSVKSALLPWWDAITSTVNSVSAR